MSKHAPGPWRAEYPRIYSQDGAKLIEVNEHMCCTVHDARLIAAAPDMLEALEHIMRCIPMGGFAQIHHGSSTWAQIDAAVSKARGELFNTHMTGA